MFLYIFDTMFKLLDTINQKNIAKSNTRILFYFKFHIKLCSFFSKIGVELTENVRNIKSLTNSLHILGAKNV